jgi:hypothetical protein
MLLSAALLGVATFAGAQPPGGRKDGPGRGKDGPPTAGDVKSFVDRMMAFDKNKDGKLTRDEITDERLLRLFDRADTNKDGVVTKEELEALYAKEMQDGGRGKDGPGGPGGPGGRFGGPGGPGGRGGFGGPPPIGQVLPPFILDQLQVTEGQKKQIADLQKEVDEKLTKILTPEQKKQLDEIKDRGPGRFGPGGPGGFGPPGGGPGGPPKKD